MNCAACGESIPAGARFCPSCGAKIIGHDEERRVVTVLFADMVGFTSLSEGRDPEQVKHLVDRCFRWLTAEIVRFGGRVDKIIGDAILALFGAPVAHEDDAERAVRAALRMQEVVAERGAELGAPIRLRIGVNTGEVLTGALAAGGDYTAMGDVVNSANRLQTAARPGEVLVGEATRAATMRVVPYEDRGSIAAKGRDEPLAAWSAGAPRTAPGERPDRTTGPMVGRDSEVTVLGGVARGALANERASLLVVVGDAGMGKSRVAAEVTASLQSGADLLLLRGRCVPYGEVNTWWPLAEALRGAAAMSVDDPLATVEERLRGFVSETLQREGVDSDVTRLASGLVPLFGFSSARNSRATGQIGDEVARSFVELLDEATRSRPVVLWLSDLHWADPAVLDLLDTALGTLARRPLVVVATSRRSLLSQWTPPVGRFDTFVMNLEALDDEAIDGLIDRVLTVEQRASLSEEMRAELRDRSGGNPLFLIELVALLDEQPSPAESVGSVPLSLPDTLRGLVAARLDRLAAEERVVVDDASVLGRRGRVEHLTEMGRLLRGSDEVPAVLATLVERDLLRVDGDTWEFASDVTREVAYSMLTKSDRATKHVGVAQWIESTYAPVRNDRIADLLAHHYGRAAELLDDLGTVDRLSSDVRDRALAWIDEVSARAEQARLLPTVERLCTQGLALTTADGGDDADGVRLELLLRRARARSQARDAAGALDDAATARELAARLGRSAAAADVLLVEGEVARQLGELDRARAVFADAVGRYRLEDDIEGTAEALRSLGMTEMFGGRTVEAEATTTAALEAYRSIGRRSGEAWAWQNLAWISFARGRIDEAEQRADESLALFDELGFTNGAAWALGVKGFILLAKGDLAAAEEVQRRVLVDARAGHERWAVAMMLFLGSVLQLWTGRTEEAVDSGFRSLEIFRAVHDRFGRARVVWPLARALAMRGRIDDARAVLDEVDRDVEGSGVVLDAPIEDRVMLAVARASVEVHAGRPEAGLEVVASLAESLGAEAIAAGLRDSGSGVDADAWTAAVAAFGTGTEPLTVLVTALAQAGRIDDAEVILGVLAPVADPDGTNAAVRVTTALVRAARGRAVEARDIVTEVLGDDRASYLDRSLAALAAGLASARLGDVAGMDDAFGEAAVAMKGTGDLLTRSLVQLAESRARAAVSAAGTDTIVDRADVSDGAAVPRQAGLVTDAHGWIKLFDLALGRPVR